MIDPKMDHINNILFSIFCGIALVLLIDSLFKKPRIATFTSTNHN